jgi:putative flippase GtrA
VVDVAGAGLAVTVPLVEVSESLQARLRWRHRLVQLVRYAVVGGLGTAVNAAIFLLLRTSLDAVPANLIALVLSTAVSTEANRRFTFGGAEVHRWRATVQNGGTVLFYAFYSSAVLLLLGLVIDTPTPLEETIAVAAASVLGGIGRFLVLRHWVFDADETADITDEKHEALAPSARGVVHPPAPQVAQGGLPLLAIEPAQLDGAPLGDHHVHVV